MHGPGAAEFFRGQGRRAQSVAGWFLRHFQNLYALEEQLRHVGAGPRLRQAERASLSQPALVRMHRALMRLKIVRRYLPQSLMGKAIDHALTHPRKRR